MSGEYFVTLISGQYFVSPVGDETINVRQGLQKACDIYFTYSGNYYELPPHWMWDVSADEFRWVSE